MTRCIVVKFNGEGIAVDAVQDRSTAHRGFETWEIV